MGLDQGVKTVFRSKVLISKLANKQVHSMGWQRGCPGETRRLTGIPELVLIPAPVTTTTFFALKSEFASSWSSVVDSGVMWTVGILERRQRSS